MRRRHVSCLFFLEFHQPIFDLNCRFGKFSTARFLALPFNPALFDRSHKPLDMLRQRADTCRRIVLLLLNPLKGLALVLAGCPDFLRH